MTDKQINDLFQLLIIVSGVVLLIAVVTFHLMKVP
jgi:hypothetical protein